MNVHYEPYYSDPLWTTRAGVLPRNNANPGNNNGQGGPYSGDFSDLISNPVVQYVAFWVNGGHDVTLHSLSFNCMTQHFGIQSPINPLRDSGFDDDTGSNDGDSSGSSNGDGNGDGDGGRTGASGAAGAKTGAAGSHATLARYRRKPADQ